MDLFNFRYFKQHNNRDKLSGVLISILLLFGIVVMILDIYSSFIQSYFGMVYLELFCLVSYVVIYSLFPKYLNLSNTIKLAIAILAVLILLSLIIKGANHYYALFWLAVLPMYIFFFLGVYRGIIWTLAVISGLILVLFNSIFLWVTPLYDVEFLFQLLLGYLAVSYLLYVLEQERVNYETRLEQLVSNQKILLKEVHHRTKNNMQIMIALLETQYFSMKDKECKRVFKSHIDRLQSIALVHEYLYKGKSYEKVELEKYLLDIVKQYQNITKHTISVNVEPITVDMRTATNLALIFNEALSNAIEHAFDPEETGDIDVVLQNNDNECVLTIKDNGKGFDTQSLADNTMGLNLIRDISSSLSDKIPYIDSDNNGTHITVYCDIKGED
jgi:two-component sensor histidine kinase